MRAERNALDVTHLYAERRVTPQSLFLREADAWTAHGELLTARWWRGVQERLRAGEIVDVFPCRDEQRLRHAR